MKSKKNKILILAIIVLCLALSSVPMYATEETTEPDFELDESYTYESESESDAPSAEPSSEEESSSKVESTKVSSTAAPPKTTASQGGNRRPANTQRPNNGAQGGNQNVVATTVATTLPSTTTSSSAPLTTELDIPEGMYVVYFEFNDGSPRRFSNPASEPELITRPADPTREGFIFDGWFRDADFKVPWYFETDFAQEGTVLYAKWNPDPSLVVYNITVIQTEGGMVEVNPSIASAGEPIRINVTPDEGMRIVPGSITVNGKKTDVLSFIMPAGDVVVSVDFEVMPEKEVIEEKPSYLPYIIGAVAILLVIIVIAVIVIKGRKDDFNDDEIDENGTIIDDDDNSWVDETIVVEDGFKDGEKVIGEFVPKDETAVFFEDEE